MPAGEIGRLETFLAKRFQEKDEGARYFHFFVSQQQKPPSHGSDPRLNTRGIRADEFLPVPVQTPAAGHSLVYPIASLATSLV